jgi:hypothetical protein
MPESLRANGLHLRRERVSPAPVPHTNKRRRHVLDRGSANVVGHCFELEPEWKPHPVALIACERVARRSAPFCSSDASGRDWEDLELLLGEVFPSHATKFGQRRDERSTDQ